MHCYLLAHLCHTIATTSVVSVKTPRTPTHAHDGDIFHPRRHTSSFRSRVLPCCVLLLLLLLYTKPCPCGMYVCVCVCIYCLKKHQNIHYRSSVFPTALSKREREREMSLPVLPPLFAHNPFHCLWLAHTSNNGESFASSSSSSSSSSSCSSRLFENKSFL